MATLTVLAVFHLATLLRTPAPFVDEAWLASRAWAFAQTGRAFGPLDQGVLEHINGYWTYYPVIGTWLQALPLEVFGLSLFAARLASLVFGIALLVVVNALTRQLYGLRVGLVAVILVGLSQSFLLSSHLARTDIMAATAGYLALHLWLLGDNSRFPVRGILSGLALGLAFDVHPNSVIFGPVILALGLLDEGRGALTSRRLWAFSIAASSGPILYLALHVLPYPASYSAITWIAFGSTKIPPIAHLSPAIWLTAFAGTGILITSAVTWWLPVILASTSALVRRRTTSDRRLLIIVSSLIASYVALIGWSATYYAIALVPALCILMAAYIAKFWRDLHRTKSLTLSGRLVQKALLVSLIPLLLYGVFDNTRVVEQNPLVDYDRVVAAIRAEVLPGQTVMGSQSYWFDLTDRNYIGWEELTYYRRYAPGTSLADAFCALHPNVFVVDKHLEQFIVDDSVHLDPWADLIRLPANEFNRFIEDHAHLVNALRTDAYGYVRIYRIDQACGTAGSEPTYEGQTLPGRLYRAAVWRSISSIASKSRRS